MNTRMLLPVAILFSSLTNAESLQGSLQKIIVDETATKASQIYFLNDGINNYQLNFPKIFKNLNLNTGDEVAIEGNIAEKVVNVESIKVQSRQSKHKNFITKLNIIGFLVNFLDMKSTNNNSISTIDNLLFNSATSVKNLYYYSTYSQVQYSRLPGPNGEAPVYVINLNYNAGSNCNWQQWVNDTKTAAQQSGINLSNYGERVYFVPSTVNCGFETIAWLGCGYNCDAVVLSQDPNKTQQLAARAVGTNLGMPRAYTDFNNDGIPDSYDNSTVMGYGNTRQLNAADRDIGGWFFDNPYQVINVTNSGQYTINSLDMNTFNMPQVLIINTPNKQGTFYISLRTNVSPFGMDAPYQNQVNVHRVPFGQTQFQTLLLALLGPGQTFNDSARGIRINVTSISPDCNFGRAVVQVTLS